MFDLRLKTFFRILLVGPSGSGKTTFCQHLLRYKVHLFDTVPARVIYYYSVWQPIFSTLKQHNLVHEFRHGVPSVEDINDLSIYAKEGGSFVVIDDPLQHLSSDVAEIFQGTARHNSVSVCLMTQNLFAKSKHFRDISLNATYVVLFKNPRDQATIANFAKQFRPGQTKFVNSVYQYVTQKPFSYLFIDLSQDIPEKLRLRTNIFPIAPPMEVFFPRG